MWFDMLKNYIAIALRNFLKHKSYTIINIAGLAIGMACCLLIALYVQDDLSYDRYHTNADRIHRITLHGRLAGIEIHSVTSAAPMAGVLVSEFPEVEAAVRLDDTSDILVRYGDRQFNESRIFFADSTYFKIFDLALISGDPNTALSKPATVVLTEETAVKYFGQEEPLGKTVRFNDNRDYTVAGVSENVPANSHFHFDMLASFVSLERADSPIWINNSFTTYVLPADQASAEQLSAKFPDLVRKYVAPQIEQGIGSSYDEVVAAGGLYEFGLQPLTDIHLRSHLEGEYEVNGNITYVYTFSAIAVFILLLACINFINLSTARAATRAREIGVRKVLGADRGQLFRQFLSESTIMSFLGVLLAVGLVSAVLPAFNSFTEKAISLNTLFGGWAWIGVLVFALLVGLIAGLYPAIYLAAFRPTEVLKGKLSSGARSNHLRSLLVVFQFAIAIILIAGTLIVGRQVDFMRTKSLGFNKEQVVVIRRAGALGDQRGAYESQIERDPNVIAAAATRHLPGRDTDNNAFRLEGRPTSENYLLATLTVGYDFIETLGIEMDSGRPFSRDFGTDNTAYIINKAAAEKLGSTTPLTERIIEPDPNPANRNIGPIIGVVKNFHFETLQEDIKPMILRLRPDARFIMVRVMAHGMQATLNTLEETWRSMTGGQPFKYSFLDQDFDNLMRADQKLGELFSFFSMLAIAIACLGPLAQTLYYLYLRGFRPHQQVF